MGASTRRLHGQKCKHCGGKMHGMAGANSCWQGRAWLSTEAGLKFLDNKRKCKEKAAAKKQAKAKQTHLDQFAFKPRR